MANELKRLSIKRKKYLMFKNKAKGDRLRRLTSLLGVFSTLALILTIVCAVLYMAALILWPIFVILLIIITLGMILISNSFEGLINSSGPFLKGITPVIMISLYIFAGLIILRFIIEWIFVLAESRSLNKNPEENAHYIAIARTVKKVKIADIIKYAVLILSIVLLVVISNAANIDVDNMTAGQKVLPVICLIVILAIFIAGKIYTKKQFKKIDGDIAAVLETKNMKQ